jgi:hypothetical protein
MFLEEHNCGFAKVFLEEHKSQSCMYVFIHKSKVHLIVRVASGDMALG